MTVLVYISIIISLAFSLGGADPFDDAITPCFELYSMGRCSTARFNEAIKCIDDINPYNFQPDERPGFSSIREVFTDKQKQCDAWINGPNPKFNVVTERCFDLYDRGRCESADFDGAIQCIVDVIHSGKFAQGRHRFDLVDIKQTWQQVKEKCADSEAFFKSLG